MDSINDINVASILESAQKVQEKNELFGIDSIKEIEEDYNKLVNDFDLSNTNKPPKDIDIFDNHGTEDNSSNFIVDVEEDLKDVTHDSTKLIELDDDTAEMFGDSDTLKSRAEVVNSIKDNLDILKACKVETELPFKTNDMMNVDIKLLTQYSALLAVKVDTIRFRETFERSICAVFKFLEIIFPGDMLIFNVNICIEGWSDIVRRKLKNSRPTTAAIMGNIMKKYAFSDGVKLMFDLLPELFIHATTTKSVTRKPVVYDEPPKSTDQLQKTSQNVTNTFNIPKNVTLNELDDIV